MTIQQEKTAQAGTRPCRLKFSFWGVQREGEEAVVQAVRLKEGYAAMAGINSEWAAMCFEADSECVFGYEEKLAESE